MEFVRGAGCIFRCEESDQAPVARSDRRGLEVMVHHEMGQLVDRNVRAECTGTGPHDSFHRLVLPPLELLRPKQTEDDALIVHDHTRVPSGGLNALSNLVDWFLQSARGHISAGHITGARAFGIRALGRKARGEPVELSLDVIADLGET